MTTIEANTKPSRILPTSPIKTFAFGIYKWEEPRQDNAMHTDRTEKRLSPLLRILNAARRPKPTIPVIPAMPFIPSMKLYQLAVATMKRIMKREKRKEETEVRGQRSEIGIRTRIAATK
jgi:hypothetical protein